MEKMKNIDKITSNLKERAPHNKYQCSQPNCNYSTSVKGNLVSHTRTHTGEKPNKCQFESCSFSTTTQISLTRHLRTHTKERPFKCPQPNCEYSATQLTNLKRHQLTHSPNPEEDERPSFSCPLCEYSGKSKEYLSQHVKRHTLEKLFKCDEPDSNCIFEARTHGEIQTHKRSKHSDEKPFACPFESCEFRCKFNSFLLQHLKRHGEERRYKCQVCPFRGKTRGDVQSHIKQVHSDSDFRRFRCPEPQCDHTSRTNGNLKTHLLIHKGEKKYSCSFPLCDFVGVLKLYVKRHEYRSHNEEKREKCPLCDHKCKAKSDLAGHMRTHTKEEPFFCTENGCTYRTKTVSGLRQHEKKNHPHFSKQDKLN